MLTNSHLRCGLSIVIAQKWGMRKEEKYILELTKVCGCSLSSYSAFACIYCRENSRKPASLKTVLKHSSLTNSYLDQNTFKQLLLIYATYWDLHRKLSAIVLLTEVESLARKIFIVIFFHYKYYVRMWVPGTTFWRMSTNERKILKLYGIK